MTINFIPNMLIRSDGYTVPWHPCSQHNWNHPGYCKPTGSSINCPLDQAPWDCGDECNGCSCDCNDHRDFNHKPATCDHRLQNHYAKPWDCSWSYSCSRSCSHVSRHSSCNYRLYIHDNKDWRWVSKLPPFLAWTRNAKCSGYPPWAKSPPVQVLAAPVASTSPTEMETHHVAPISEIAAPKKIQQVPFINYPTPLPPPDSYVGECLDVSSSLDSEDRQPKSTPAWHYNDTDSYGSYCPEGKKVSCKRPPTIKSGERFLFRFKMRSKTIPMSGNAWDLSWPQTQKYLLAHAWLNTLLAHACFTVNARWKARKNQSCFIKRDQNSHNELEKLLQKWRSLSSDKKEQGLAPLQVKDLSHQQQEFYNTQKAQYQANANAYTTWSQHQWKFLPSSE